MSGIKRKKLYFDVSLVAVTKQTFPCTQFRNSYSGDRYGGVLDDLPPITSTGLTGQLGQRKRAADVRAWFQPTTGANNVGRTYNFTGPDTGTVNITILAERVFVQFMGATTTTSISGGGTAALTPAVGAIPAGATPIGTRHFAVRVSRQGTNSATVRGILHVERQHSFEV